MNPAPARPRNGASETRSWRRAALRIAGSALALFLLFHFLPLGQTWTTVRRLPAHFWLLLLAGYLAAHFIGANKWRLMVNLADAGLSLSQAVQYYFAGLFSTLFLPSIIGGDVVRAGLALRVGRNKPGVLLGSLLDRIVDLSALALLAACGAFLAPEALSPAVRRIFWLVGALILAALAALAALLVYLPARRFSFRMRRRLARLREARRSMARRPHYVLGALGLGLAVQTSYIWLTAALARACALRLAFGAWLFAWPLAKLSAVVPVTQGGIGVREAALAALLAPFGAPPAMTVAVGLAWEAVIISGGLIAGLAAFSLGRFAARRRESEVAETRSPLSRS